MKRYVVGFMFPVRDPELVMLLRKKTADKPDMDWQDGLLNGIGGKVETGEWPDQAMERECLEEAGLTLDWERVATLQDGTFLLDIYRADLPSVYDVLPKNDVGERFEVHRIDEVVRASVKTIPNLQWMVPMCMGGDRDFWPFIIHQKRLEAKT